MIEAPEGIVAYSWSGQIPLTSGLRPAPIFTQTQIQTLLNKTGLILVGQNAFIDLSDRLGQNYKNTEKLVLSNSYVETLDLISEGMIEGPISGEYIYSGTIGQTGWNTAQFSGFTVSSGFENSRWLRSIYWNQIPILSDQGQFNFQNVQASYAVGTANGTAIQTLINQETTTRTLGERLRGPGTGTLPKVYRILNPNCRGVAINVKVPTLSDSNADNGNIRRSRIDWQIQYRPLFSDIQNQTDFSNPISETVWGKIISAGGYVRSTTINFNTSQYLSKQIVVQNITTGTPVTITTDTPVSVGNFLDNPNFIGWELQIIRTTADSNSSLIQNATYIDSITELYGSTFTYPNSAVFSSLFNAEFFNQVPDRAFECKLLKVQIPGNYDPIKRVYATGGFATTNGYWNGTFASGVAWTNNPAWCFYDLLTNTRYGLGRFIDNISVDKFSLYRIGQYCDELVPDGQGFLEPRFTCNTLIGSREEAFKVINDLASVFRGAAYYAYGNVYAVQDSIKSPRVIFTNANVENGDFIYSSSSKKSRQSVAVVRWNNPTNFYQPAIEYVEDLDAVRKYGIRELDLTAFACTSRGQAIRLGNWALLSNNIETETVQFTTSLEATSLRLGDVFKVFDYNRKWKRYGGRIYNINNLLSGDNITVTGSTIQLDSVLDLQSGIQYNLSVLTPSYYYDSSQITGMTDQNSNDIRRNFLQNFYFSGDTTSISGNYSIINLINTGFNTTNYVITGYPIYTIELGPNSSSFTGSNYFINQNFDYYRVINIKESDLNKYEVIGLQYVPQKFAEIDSGIVYQRSITLGSNNTPASPYGLVLTTYNTSNSTQIVHYSFLIDNYNFVNNYKVFVTTGSFPAGIPDNSSLSAILPSDVLQGIYSPIYFPSSNSTFSFRVYAYNSIDNLYSNSYAAGSINVSLDNNITNVIISSLQYVG